MHLAAYMKLGKSSKFFFMRISEFFQYFINIRLKKITSSEEMRRLLGKNKINLLGKERNMFTIAENN